MCDFRDQDRKSIFLPLSLGSPHCGGSQPPCGDDIQFRQPSGEVSTDRPGTEVSCQQPGTADLPGEKGKKKIRGVGRKQGSEE